MGRMSSSTSSSPFLFNFFKFPFYNVDLALAESAFSSPHHVFLHFKLTFLFSGASFSSPSSPSFLKLIKNSDWAGGKRIEEGTQLS